MMSCTMHYLAFLKASLFPQMTAYGIIWETFCFEWIQSSLQFLPYWLPLVVYLKDLTNYHVDKQRITEEIVVMKLS